MTLLVASLGRVLDFRSFRRPDPFSFFVMCCDDWLGFDNVFVLIIAFESISIDRKSTRLNSSHGYISYAVFCLKKKKKKIQCMIVLTRYVRWTRTICAECCTSCVS